MHYLTLEDIVRPYTHLPKTVQTALLRVETHPAIRVLTRSAHKVLKALVTRVNATNGMTPIKARVDTVAMQAGVSTKTTQRTIKVLDELGWMKAVSDGRSQWGGYCSKQYAFSADLCALLHLPTKKNPLQNCAEETEMSDGGIHDLSFEKDQREISFQNRKQNHTPIQLPEALQAMARETGIKDTGIAKLRGMAHRLGHKLEDVYVVAKKHLAAIGQNSARAYCYVQAMLANPKKTDFAAKTAQLIRLTVAADAKASTVEAWGKYRNKTYAAGPGRTVTILHDCAHVYVENVLTTLIVWRDIGQVIKDIEDGKLVEISGREDRSMDPQRYCAVGDDGQAQAARQLLGQTLEKQEAMLRQELASKALPSSKDANLAMALALLRRRSPRTSAKSEPATAKRPPDALIESRLSAICNLVGLTPRGLVLSHCRASSMSSNPCGG